MNLFQLMTDGVNLDALPTESETKREPIAFEPSPGGRFSVPSDLNDAFNAAASDFGIDADVLRAVAHTESRFNPDVVSGKVKSRTGAIGLMQFMPDTAKEYGINPVDPVESIFGAAAYLRKSLDKFDGDYGKAVASYNAGPNRKDFDSEDWDKRMPAETQDYLRKVFTAADQLKQGAPAAPAPVQPAPDTGDETARLAARYKAPDAPQQGGFIQSVGDFFKPAPTSVLESYKPTAAEQQAANAQRLRYGAGPIKGDVLVAANEVASGNANSSSPTVNAVAKQMQERGDTFTGYAQSKNTPILKEGARDAKAAEFRSAGEWAVDSVSALAQGSVSIPLLPASILAPGGDTAKTLRSWRDAWSQQESDVLKAQRAVLKNRIQSEEGFAGKYAATVLELVTNPALGMSEAIKQVPNYLAVIGTSRLAAGAVGTGFNAIEKSSPTLALANALSSGAVKGGAQATAATAGGMAASVVMTSGDAAGDVYETLTDPNKTPKKVWEQNEDYQALIKQGLSHKAAVMQIAEAKARFAAVVVAPLGLFGFMGAESALATKGIAGLAASFGPKAAAKTFGKEIVGENIEEGGTKWGGNVVTSTVDPRVKWDEGVAEAAATATVTSAPMAGLAARSQLSAPPAQAQNPRNGLIAAGLLDPQTYDGGIVGAAGTANPLLEQLKRKPAPTVESQPTTPTAPPAVGNPITTPSAPDASQAVDNIASLIKQAEAQADGAPDTAVTSVEPEKQAASFAQRTATPTPLPGVVPQTTPADAGVRAMVDSIKKKRAQDAEETLQIQQMLAEDDAKAEALRASSTEETTNGQAEQIAIKARARLIDDLVSSYAEPSEFFASRVLPAVDKQLSVLGRPPLAKDERARVDALLGSTRAFIRPSLPSAPEAAPVLTDAGADNSSLESLIKPKKPAVTVLAAEMAALKARSQPQAQPAQQQQAQPRAKVQPLLTDGEREMLGDFERLYQADVKGEIKTRLGLMPARQEEATAPAEKRKPSTVLALIKAAGGINPKVASDIFGENAGKANKAYPGLFKEGGKNFDMLVTFLKERGFITQADEDSVMDNGGINKVTELIQGELSGERAKLADSTAGFEADAGNAIRSELDEKAFALGLPMKVTNGMSTERLNGVINRIERKLGKPVNMDFATRKMSRTEAMAERQAILMADRVERARAQYDADIQAFAESDDAVQDAVLEIATDADGNVDIVYTRAVEAASAADALNGQWSDQNAEIDTSRAGASQEDSGQAGAPVAQGAQAGTGNPEGDRTEAGAGQEGLTAYTPEEVTARQDATAQAEATAKRAEEAAARAEAAAKQASEIAQRSVAAADTFELGGNAEDNLSGQQGLRFSRASENRAARAALARIMEKGVTSPDDLRALLRVPGYSKWAKSTIAGDVAGAAALRRELQDAFPGSDWKAPKLIDQGIITIYPDWVGLTSQSLDNLTKLADKYDTPIGVRGGAATKQLVSRLDGFGFELYNGLQERADRMPNVMFGMIRPAGGITATTPLFSQGAKSPRTPISTITQAITKAYGNLLTRLEGKGLVSLTQTEEEAIAAAAQARADQNGGDVEAIKRAMRASVLASQRAWHGTPHRGIEKFSTDKIGTGEGAQAFGWGLYFADRRELGEYYKDKLSDPDIERAVVEEYTIAGDRNWIATTYDGNGDKISRSGYLDDSELIDLIGEDAFNAVQNDESDDDADVYVGKRQGQLYEVDIPNDSDMLLWDKPLSEQPAKVREVFDSMNVRTPAGGKFVGTKRVNEELTGREAYQLLSGRMNSDKAASEALLSAGVRGIKYLDGTSRNAGEGTYNYVVFSGDDVQIVDVKYSKDGNLEGFFDPATGKSFLIADNLTAESAPATLMHEVGIHMAADGKLEPLFKRAGNMLKLMKNDPFIQRVQYRMDESGETSNEEAAAYIVTEYEKDRTNAPQSVVNWVKDFIADVRAWLFSKGVILKATQLNVADIAAVARANARGMARGDAVIGETADIRRSVAGGGQQNDSQAKAAVTRSLWKDESGRMQFAPGAWLFDKMGNAASPFLSWSGMKAASPELKKQLREMKLGVQKAQETSAMIATEASKLSQDEREMVSDLIEKTLKAGVVPPAHAVKLAALINETMSKQTDELIELGMLSTETAERWRGEYLPRFYADKLRKNTDPWADALKNITKRARMMMGVKGKHLKARGLFETVAADQVADYEALGWEVRDPDFDPATDETAQMWRDFTPEERENMGEIRDAGFRFVMGYMQTQKDIALGRMFKRMADADTMSSRLPTGEFTVRVPDTKVEGTGAKVYGALAGRYVSKDTLDHLSGFGEVHNDMLATYRKAMSLWKEGKTVLNPVSHVNNTISNVTMAHLAGVGYHRVDKYAAAVRDFAKGSKMIQEAKDAGLFLGGFNEAELFDSMPDELKALAKIQEGTGTKVVNGMMQALTFGLRKPMAKAYEFEDSFFKYLIYRDARSRGMDAGDAVDYAQKYIFTYDDLPKTARKIRDFGLPFFAYTYKAVPAMLETAMKHPVRMALPAAMIWAGTTLAYALAEAGDDEPWDELAKRYANDSAFRDAISKRKDYDQEHLPQWMRGYTSLAVPKSIRVGMDETLDMPVFMDISRLIPGGDLFDVTPNAGGLPLPQPLTPNHPILTMFTGLIGNKDTFKGNDLVDENDNSAEAAEKRTVWIYRQVAPAIAVGNYHWDRGMEMLANAAGGEIKWLPEALSERFTGIGKDGLPITPEYGIPQTFGIKIRPMDQDKAEAIEQAMDNKLLREIDAEIRQINRLNSIGAMSDKLADKKIDYQLEKKDRIREGLTVDGDARR